MSALRISRPGYPTEFVIQEPATATVRGHGGSAMGYWSGTTLTIRQERDNQPKKRLRRAPLGRPTAEQQRCGIPTRFGDPCGRMLDHAPFHMSAEAVARRAARMRS